MSKQVRITLIKNLVLWKTTGKRLRRDGAVKRVSSLLMLIIFFCSAYIPTANANLTEEDIIETITNDFIDTHKVNLEGFELLHNRKINWNRQDLTTEQQSLAEISRNIHGKQILGDYAPLFYLNEEEKKGYVLEKKLSGSSMLYILAFDDTTKNWKVTKRIDKMGKDLVELGLLKNAN